MKTNPFPVMEINIDSISNNYRVLSEYVGRSTEVSCVVKSDAYGLGVERVVPALSDAGATSFYVGYQEEGLVAKSLVPSKDIYVLYPTSQDALRDCFKKGLIPVLNSEEDIDAVLSLDSCSVKKIAVYIDTGMNRIGISDLLTTSMRKKLNSLAAQFSLLLISHYSDAERKNIDHCQRQEAALKSCATSIKGNVRLGIANTGGVLLPDLNKMDQVRLGAAVFGFHHNPLGRIYLPEGIKPTVKVSTTVLGVRKIEKGGSFGYEQSFIAVRDSTIAIIRMGYSHGFPRQHCLKDYGVIVGGHTARVVGSIGMETMAVDISTLPPGCIKAGDIATVVADAQHAEELAFSSGTLVADIYCRMGSGCSRKFIKHCEGKPVEEWLR